MFVSSPHDGTENVSTQFWRNSLLSSKSSRLFFGTSAAQKERQGGGKQEGVIRKLQLETSNITYTKEYLLPTILGREDLHVGPFKLTQ